MKHLPAFIIAIHISPDIETTHQAAVTALAGGARGIFLIDHDARKPEPLLHAYNVLRERLTDLTWIGLNFLCCTPEQAIEICPPSADGLWFDDCHLAPDDAWPKAGALHRKFKMFLGANCRSFGSVMFKYQPHIGTDVGLGALQSSFWFDVVTTSGPATGSPPDQQKIWGMQEALKSYYGPRNQAAPPLAVASGISAQNIGPFLSLANCFIVASSVSDSFHEINGDKVRELAEVIYPRKASHDWSPSDMEVLIHYHASVHKHPRHFAPAVEAARRKFLEQGLIEPVKLDGNTILPSAMTEDHERFHTTEKGRELVASLCQHSTSVARELARRDG